MNVANKGIIRKLTMRTLSSDKRRNFFIIAAIALTTFMITSVFSVGVSYYATIKLAPFRLEGVFAHTALAAQSPENTEKIRSLNYVRSATTTYRVGIGYLNGFEQGSFLAATNEESWRFTQTPVYTNIVGSVATAENEIMLSRAHLEQMGIDEAYIGMEIPMEFVVGDYAAGEFSGRYSETLVLSAIYTEYVSLNPGNVYTPIFVSEAFAERYGQHKTENTDVRIVFKNQNRAVEYTKRLAQDLNLDYEREIAVHPALLQQTDTGLSTMVIAIVTIALFFIFVGFLLIYNVMYISVSKDVRFYGLLKTMGTTPRQLRRIVNGQVLLMYIAGLPIGLATAALTSFALVPAMGSGTRTGTVVSFSPLIFIGGAVFALITAYIGASISARKAAKVSPIEAIKYAGTQNVNLKPRSSANGKASRMAWRNMFRERKRALIVLLSLFLGITVFIGAMAIVNSTDIDGDIAYWYDHDIIISAINTESDDFGIIGMDRELIDEIAALPGVSEVREQTLGIALFDYPWEAFSPLLEITGLDRTHMEELNKKMETPINIEAFEHGEIVLADDRHGALVLGDMFYDYFPVGTELYFEIGEQARIPINTKIAGYQSMHNMTSNSISFISGGLSLIMSNTFLDGIAAKGGVNHLGVMVEDGMEESVNAAISAIAGENGLPTASIYEARRAGEEARLTMFVLGVTISGILALIGLFNFINLISVGLLTRKREFAALESVGMSKKQMRLMLRWEGAIYWILTITASITAGTGIAYGLFNLVANQSPKQFPQFNYPFMPVAVVLCLIILICTITPEICYRGISKMTLVERLRETE